MSNESTIALQKKQTNSKKIIKYVLIGVACLLLIACLVGGPIILQEFNNHESSGHDVAKNIGLCWLGAIMIAIPIISLSVACFILIFKTIFKKNKGE